MHCASHVGPVVMCCHHFQRRGEPIDGCHLQNKTKEAKAIIPNEVECRIAVYNRVLHASVLQLVIMRVAIVINLTSV